MKAVLVRAEEGKTVEVKVVDEDLHTLVKEVAGKALTEWDPSSSDFTVMKVKLEVRYPHPISPDLYDKVVELGLQAYRDGKDVVIELPMYVISFDNTWLGDAYHDRKIYVVTYYLDDNSLKSVEEYAAEATRGPKKLGVSEGGELQLSPEALEKLEEGLKELEEEAGAATTTSKKRKRKK